MIRQQPQTCGQDMQRREIKRSRERVRECEKARVRGRVQGRESERGCERMMKMSEPVKLNRVSFLSRGRNKNS